MAGFIGPSETPIFDGLLKEITGRTEQVSKFRHWHLEQCWHDDWDCPDSSHFENHERPDRGA